MLGYIIAFIVDLFFLIILLCLLGVLLDVTSLLFVAAFLLVFDPTRERRFSNPSFG